MTPASSSYSSIKPALGGLVALIILTATVLVVGFHLLDARITRMLRASDLDISTTMLERELQDGYRFLALASDDLIGPDREQFLDTFVLDFSQRIERLDHLEQRVREMSEAAGSETGASVSNQVAELRESWSRALGHMEIRPEEATIELMLTSDPLSESLLGDLVPRLLAEAATMKANATVEFERISNLSILAMLVVFVLVFVAVVVLVSHIVVVLKQQQVMERELHDAVLHAKDANVAKSRFLSNMSHELRTPMNGVIGMANVLEAQSLPKNQRTMVDVLKTSADATLALINDILDFESIEAGKVTLESRGFELAEVVKRIERLATAQLTEKPISFHVHQMGDVPTHVEGDEHRLTQILTNLVSNAIKFTDKGQVELQVSVDEDNNLLLQVSDSGIGIPADRLDSLFDAFSQGDDSIRRRYGGTGLGLSITRSLVHMMNGSMTVASEPGRGSVFSVSLPLLEIAPDEEAIDDEPTVPVLDEGLTLLCVDDNPLNIEVARYLLQESGVTFRAAESGREALAMLAEEPADVVLMDCHMVGMDGFETSLRIRELYPQTAVMALTADATVQTMERCERSGMQGFVTKPFTPDSLMTAIHAVLDGNPVREK